MAALSTAFGSPQAPVSLEDQWRAIILFGRNVASYKFALAKTLLYLQPASGSLVRLEDLALPFALNLCEHLKLEDKQATSSTSKFLEGCRAFNRGELSQDDLQAHTAARGFANVIDAFHRVGHSDTPQRFFIDERRERGGVCITDEFEAFAGRADLAGLSKEVEARWRLVESAWRLQMPRAMVVSYDAQAEALLLPDATQRRRAVTGSREALNGYQKGRCFYCRAHIPLTDGPSLADVDHFLPHTLKRAGFGNSVDGVWNLVLACQACNRGQAGKFDRLPALRLLQRLNERNESLISSHHPLRETLVLLTGATAEARRGFLSDMYERARAVLVHADWEAHEVPGLDSTG